MKLLLKGTFLNFLGVYLYETTIKRDIFEILRKHLALILEQKFQGYNIFFKNQCQIFVEDSENRCSNVCVKDFKIDVYLYIITIKKGHQFYNSPQIFSFK